VRGWSKGRALGLRTKPGCAALRRGRPLSMNPHRPSFSSGAPLNRTPTLTAARSARCLPLLMRRFTRASRSRLELRTDLPSAVGCGQMPIGSSQRSCARQRACLRACAGARSSLKRVAPCDTADAPRLRQTASGLRRSRVRVQGRQWGGRRRRARRTPRMRSWCASFDP
jgi:hypothetical protein